MPEVGQFLHTLQFNLEPPISFLSLLTALCISIFAMAFGEGLLQALWGNPLPTLIPRWQGWAHQPARRQLWSLGQALPAQGAAGWGAGQEALGPVASVQVWAQLGISFQR